MHTCHHQFPKGFAHKLLTLLETFDDKAQRGKLTRTIADHGVAHGLRETSLQAQRLKTCKRCASLTIALFRRIRSGICQDWAWRFDKRLLSRSYFNFIKSFGSGSEEKKKMKRLFLPNIFAFSRSQSVQMISFWHVLISRTNVLCMSWLFSGDFLYSGASNSSTGWHECHFWKAGGNSSASKWPDTDAIIIWQCWLNMFNSNS